jgi:putative peptidoglycan binding protein
MMKRLFLFFMFVTFGAVCPLHADDSIRAVQTRLKAGGFYFGKINGNYDKETAAGVTRYQIRNGLQITGKLDAQTRYALGLSDTPPKVPMPKLGEDVWRYLRKSDQETIRRLMAEDARKKTHEAEASASPPPVSAAAVSEGDQAGAMDRNRPSPARAAKSASYDRERLRDYVAAFVLAGLDPHVGAEAEFFADRVDYFGEHGFNREKIRRDLRRYDQRWPVRSFRLSGDVDVQPVGDRLKVAFPLRYELQNGKRRAAGKVLKTLVLEKTGDNDLQIVAVNERKTES